MALRDVLAELERAHADGVFTKYALGGAVAATVYLEPMATEDVDVFVTIATGSGSRLVTLAPLYSYFKARGATVEGERLEIGGWLVQFLPPNSALVDDALEHATPWEVEGVRVPVFSQEHLAAIALETGRLKDKVRLKGFLESPDFDRDRFLVLVAQFGLGQKWERVQEFFKENE
jgi:redox-regulated HSP33 family molecular chaperone